MEIYFFPTKSITITTRLSEAQAFERLEACINPSATMGLYLTEDTFLGEIKPPNFIIHEKVPPRSNSFIPILKGNIRQGEGQIKMQLGGCIIAFAVVWCYVPCLLFSLNFRSWLDGGEFSPTILFVCMGALGIMWGMMNYGFRNGEIAAKAFLIKTFDGELV